MDPPHHGRDRSLIHNPNYPPTHNTASTSYSSYASTAQRSPYDPFQRRDPFMPSHGQDGRDAATGAAPGPARASSNGFWSHEQNGARKEMFQAAPGGAPGYGDEGRRRSPVSGLPLETSFGSRRMPPPDISPQRSPPPSERNALNHRTSQVAAASRDAPAPFSSARSNNMSISSIMGVDDAAGYRPRTSWSASGGRMSPKRGPFREPPSSHDLFSSGARRDQEFQSREAQVAGTQYAPGRSDSPLGLRLREFQGLPPSTNLPPRPYSQPSGQDRDVRGGHPEYMMAMSSGDKRPVSHEQGRAEERWTRDRSHSDLVGARGPQYPAYGTAAKPRVAPIEQSSGRVEWMSTGSEAPQYGPLGLPEYGPAPRPHSYETARYGSVAVSQEAPVMYGPAPREVNGMGSNERLDERHTMRPSLSSDSLQGRTVSLDVNLRRSLEESQMPHKHIMQDARRLDRGSPLPQAVQGASSQPAGLGRDPHVKREFGNIFSGLGSGIGSTPQPVSHPHGHPSDMDEAEGDFGRRRSTYDHPGSRSWGRGKRGYDDDRMDSGDSADGRASPISLSRAGKRSKLAHAHHHHHHHATNHHHHHHHRRAEDDVAETQRRGSGTPIASSKYANGQTTTPHHHHHSHHHHHTHHHHHHMARTASQPVALQMRRPIVTIKTRPLVESVSDKPRRHLGSHMYSPRLTLPSSSSTTITSKRHFATEPNPLPRLDGKENCTITIRVKHEHLTRAARERICAQRRIWGTDVYTDDSDPICAAMHAGWIRGSWAEDVDTSLLDLEPASPNAHEAGGARKEARPADLVLTEPPTATGPRIPPEGRDMHMTLLILPALERYAASTWHGVRSRSWGGNHDGMSIKIERIEFVEQGDDWTEGERGPAAIKKRLRIRDGLEGVVGSSQCKGLDVMPIGFGASHKKARASVGRVGA